MKSSQIQPYLFFGGRCEEALQFYQKTLGATIDMIMRYNESPQPMPPGSIPAGFEKKVMHSTFHIGESIIMASDGENADAGFGGFSLSLTCSSEEEAKRVFGLLAEGGQVTLPITKTFWSPCFGMLRDRFGLGWMIGVASNQSS
jgi:PhnB protein